MEEGQVLGTMTLSYEGTDYASGVLMRPDGSALMLSMESASLFLP